MTRDRIGICAHTHGNAHRYQRHRPAQPLRYKLVAQHYPVFAEQTAFEGRSLPDYVRRECDEFLR